MAIQSISPFLWFNSQAQQASEFYVSLFPDSRITRISYYGDAGPGPKGTVMVVDFQLQGWRFTALNGGPAFQLDEAFSLLVDCTEQADIDRLWQALGQGGTYNVCGWLKDRFGVSWQINYAGLGELVSRDPEVAGRVMAAMMDMEKIDVQALIRAAAGSA